MNDINHIHKFTIGNTMEMELLITRKNGFWESKVLKGCSGMRNSSGGVFNTLQEYIKDIERGHTYTYNFFKHGYQSAKQLINK